MSLLQGSNAATVLQHDELRVAAARLLAAQGMVRQGYMPDAIRNGPVSGWPSPSASSEEFSNQPAAPSSTSKRVGTAFHCTAAFHQADTAVQLYI